MTKSRKKTIRNIRQGKSKPLNTIKPVKENKLIQFDKKNRKKILLYNIIVWTILLILLMTYNAKNNNVTREYIEQQVEERCFNNITLPEEGALKVKFDYNEITNITMCEVIQ